MLTQIPKNPIAQIKNRSVREYSEEWSTLIGRQLLNGDQRFSFETSHQLHSFVKFAIANKSLARVLPAMIGLTSEVSDQIQKLRVQHQNRLEEALRLLDETQQICVRMDVPFLVLKSFDALPDLGHDIDLLVGTNLGKVRSQLLKTMPCSPVTLTFCDRQAGKFSTFIDGYTFDFELYARISQLGEEYVASQGLLENRKKETFFRSETYLCSLNDRLLVTCIHTIYRHGKLRLSDVNVAFDAFKAGVDSDSILGNVETAGIQRGFALFIAILEQAAINFAGSPSIIPAQLRNYSRNLLVRDRLLAMTSKHFRIQYPLKLPIWLSVGLFLYKAGSDFSRKKLESGVRCLLAPLVLLLDKAIPLRLQKAMGVRIW